MSAAPAQNSSNRARVRLRDLNLPAQIAARWSLGQRLAVLVGVVLTIIVAAFGYIAYDGVRQSAISRSSTRIEGVARELADMVRTALSARAATLSRAGTTRVVQQLLVDTSALTEANRSAVQATLDSLLMRLPAANGVRPVDSSVLVLALARADGAERYRSAPLSERDSAMLAAAMTEAVHRDTVVRTPLYVQNGQVHYWTVVPVASIGVRRATGVRERQTAELPGVDPAPAGVLAELRRVAGSPAAERRIQSLTGEDMHVLLTNEHSTEWSTLTGVPIPVPFALPTDDSVAMRVAHATAGPQYAVQVGLPGTPWHAVVTQPESSILTRPRDFLRRIQVAGALLLALGILSVWWLTRRETQPLDALRDATIDVAQGQYTRRVSLAGGSEIASLAYMFNAMAARIGDTTSMLESQNVALTEANQAKARFLAVMSHELRTPLNAIGGYVDLIRLGVYGPTTAEQSESLQRVQRSKDQLLRIVSDILQYAKLDAGQLMLRRETVDVSQQFASVAETLGEQAASNRVGLIVEPTTAQVYADAARLQQVLLNLVTNALRFTLAGGSVTLATESHGESTSLHVRDTGVGIAPDQLEQVFEPFRQVDSSLTRKVGGTGLGLSIVRELTMAMGGTVRVESTVGTGSVFTVILETARANEARHEAGSRALEVEAAFE